jgi:1-acyl-sn-glycerol-3-phosphate acyltransferase
MPFSQRLARWILNDLMGFKVTGIDPELYPQKVFVVYPHTSNWDFPLGILCKFGMPINVNFVAKASLFRWPFGKFFRFLGGIPVERGRSTNFVDQMIKLYDQYPVLGLAIAPEGTRKYVGKFKSGFYYIADGAKVPIIMVKFDWGNRVVDYSEPFYTTGNYNNDLKSFIEHFKGTQGYIAANGSDWAEEEF